MMNDIIRFVTGWTNRDSQEYTAARRELIAEGDEAIHYLSEMMLEADEGQAWRAARLLSGIDNPGVVLAFKQALKSRHVLVRQLVIQALGESGDTEAVFLLLDQMNHEVGIVQMSVIDALGHLGDRGVIEPLLKFLRQTRSATVQYSIIKAFGALGDPSVAPALLPLFNSEDRHVVSKAQEVYSQLTSSGWERQSA